jgi:8-oxo-dGTP diphosphatase
VTEQRTEKRYDGWPRLGASAAIFRGGEILLIQRAKGGYTGLWSLPGGHVEPGERTAEAARREVHEETGVTAEIDGFVDIHEIIVGMEARALAAHYVLTVYHGHWVSGEASPASDSRDARFFSLDALDDLPLTPEAKSVIAKACALHRLAFGGGAS